MLISHSVNTVLFDLDGTLIDHFQTIYRCYCYAQAQMGLEPVSYETVKATVGGSMPVTMARLLGEEKAEEGVNHFRKHFDEIMLEDLKALPGTLWILKELSQRDYKLAVFTNKTGAPSRVICEHLGYSPYLKRVIGTVDTPYRKPQVEFSQHVLSELGSKAEETVMIGDSPFDVAAAKSVGMPCYGVTTGSHTAEQLKEEAPEIDGIFTDMIALGEAVFGLKFTGGENG